VFILAIAGIVIFFIHKRAKRYGQTPAAVSDLPEYLPGETEDKRSPEHGGLTGEFTPIYKSGAEAKNACLSG
jgi:hypothetical protein